VQNAETVLTAITCVNLPKIKTAHKFDEVTAERDKTEELYVEQQNAVHTALASHKYFENNHTALKTISVQVVTKKAEFEVQKYVESKKAGSAVLADIKTAKTDELKATEGFEESHVLQQRELKTLTLDPSTFVATLYEPAEHNEVAAEFTEPEIEKISAQSQVGDKAEKVNV
jgi:hypothetical protein